MMISTVQIQQMSFTLQFQQASRQGSQPYYFLLWSGQQESQLLPNEMQTSQRELTHRIVHDPLHTDWVLRSWMTPQLRIFELLLNSCPSQNTEQVSSVAVHVFKF